MNKLRLLTLAILFHATSSMAIPMLSGDGSSLTGVDVEGTLYNVTFGDGIVSDVYAGVTFDAARETEARAVINGIALAFIEIGIGTVAADDIAGCTGTRCTLFNPWLRSSDGAIYEDAGSIVFLVDPVGNVVLAGQAGSNFLSAFDNTALRESYTLVTYREKVTTVPVPAVGWLFGSGLLGLCVIKRKKS